MQDNLNWYAYCGGDPVNSYDPWGLRMDSKIIHPVELQKSIISMHGDGLYIGPDNPFSHPSDKLIYNPLDDSLDPGITIDSEGMIKSASQGYSDSLSKANSKYLQDLLMLDYLTYLVKNGKKLTQSQIDWLINFFFDPDYAIASISSEGLTNDEFEKFKNDVIKSLKYIAQTSAGAELILDIIYGTLNYRNITGIMKTLKIVKTTQSDIKNNSLDDYNNSVNDSYNYETWIIYWNPEMAIKVKSTGDFISPALALAHELGHHKQYLYGDYDAYIKTKDPKEKDKIEENCVKYYENVIAQQLNALGFHEGIRNSYKDVEDGWFYVIDPTSTAASWFSIDVLTTEAVINTTFITH